MDFKALLDELCKELSCSQRKLSEASGLSASVISRYLSGERIPSAGSEQIQALAKGFEKLAKEANISSLNSKYTYDNLISLLEEPLHKKEHDYENFVTQFNRMIEVLKINMKSMANDTSFDVSYLYRVRSGERHPVDLGNFCTVIADYIAKKYSTPGELEKVAKLLGCEKDLLHDRNLFQKAVLEFLTSETAFNIPKNTQVSDFLQKMDEFDLNDFIRVIHFDELKIPTLPMHLPTTKTYYGLEDMRKAELDFFKMTATSKSSEPIFMCSDMPMTEMANDMDFNKKWMFAIAASIKKGYHINIVHDVERPFEELMLGFEAWIPIYMTGQVSPYHFPGYKNTTFRQLNYCSGAAALHGECIEGFHGDGKYYLTNNKTELSYYKKKCENILANAKPLMDIYDENRISDYSKFLEKYSKEKYDRCIILSSLPLYTIPEKLLKDMIKDISTDKKDAILQARKLELTNTEQLLISNKITVNLMELSKEEFEKHPMRLFLASAFISDNIEYTYEQYKEHLKATKAFEKAHDNYVIEFAKQVPFRNIQVEILKDHAVVISKIKSPAIHFVIQYPTMVRAFENFEIAKTD